MNFWHNVQTAAGPVGLHWLIPLFLAAVVLLFIYVPAERSRLRNSVYLFALAFGGLCAAALIGQGGAGYGWVRWTALFLLWVSIINVASVLVFNVLLEAVRLKPARIMRDLLVALAYIVVGIVILSRSGVDLTGIVATSAVITAVIGFSLQDTLGNVMGGMALQTERTISVGDWIRVGTDEGQVKEIRWRQTSIETRNWDTIVIPNSVLMRSQVTLLGHRAGAPRQQRRWVYFNVDFRYSPPDVITAVEAALTAEPIENVAREPAPHCLMTDFKDSYATYAARYWITDLGPTDPTDGVVRARICFALRRAGIPLSIPARALFITEDDEMRRERKHHEEIEQRVAALQNVELFFPLTDEERGELAEKISVAPFVKGEAITRQGAEAHWLYIIRKGEAEVRVKVEGGDHNEHVATLHKGDFFGEMGLLTGEPRTATVIALTDVECYRVNKEVFEEGLRRRPEIARDISRLLARRRVELDSVLGQLNADVLRQQMQNLHGDFLHRIRKFFSLDGEK
ncbi:MAG: cyclic nucleotide-binding domain-containing protein [Pyrinomonadaceae bacterium]